MDQLELWSASASAVTLAPLPAAATRLADATPTAPASPSASAFAPGPLPGSASAPLPTLAPAPVSQSTPALELSGPDLLDYLRYRLNKPVHLTLTNNRSTMLSWREERGVVRLRLHRTFLRADADTLESLARYLLGGDRKACRELDRFLATVRPPPRPAAACRPSGRYHDLRAILDELNHRFFHDAVQVAITWGSAGRRRYRRSILLGTYHRDEKLIRIHPCLDQAFVPRQYVAWVVFHEMLHDVFGIGDTRSGRRSVHPPEFMAIEQTFPNYPACKAWEDQNMHRLLRFHG